MKSNQYPSVYEAPEISVVRIDQEITLVLVSPPYGPDESMLNPEYLKVDPLQENLA